MGGFEAAFGRWVVKHRWWLIAATVLAVLGAASGLSRLAVTNDTRIFFSKKNPQLEAREDYQEIEHPELGEALRYPGPPYRLSETPWRIERRAPRLGEHTHEVLGEVGYSEDESQALSSTGAAAGA